jgi:hypothetical protein
MVPTLCATLGVKGHRPVVGTRDCKDLLYVYAAVNCVDGRLHTRTLQSRQAQNRAAKKKGVSKTRRMQEGFAKHLRDVAGAYPAGGHRRVVLVIDNAPWHRGRPIDDVLAEHPHLELYRLPSYSPKLNVIERFWKPLRRRATHNRLFDDLQDLKASIRNSLRYFQTVRSRIMSLVGGCYGNQTASAGT